MDRYETIEKLIFSVFASESWKATNIKTYPNNFKIKADECIRVNILCNNGLSVDTTGMLLIDIFTKSNKGRNNTLVIADKIDYFFSKKIYREASFGVLQFFQSSLSTGKEDSDNTLLFKSNYSISFKHWRL